MPKGRKQVRLCPTVVSANGTVHSFVQAVVSANGTVLSFVQADRD